MNSRREEQHAIPQTVVVVDRTVPQFDTSFRQSAMSALEEGSKAPQAPSAYKMAEKEPRSVRADRFATVKNHLDGIKENERASVISSYKASYEKSLKEHGPENQSTLNNLELWAFVLHEFKDYRGATNLYEQAVETRKRIGKPPYTIDFLQVHQQFAKNFMGQRRHHIAAQMFKENYEWCRNHPELGENDAHTLRVGFDLAVSLHDGKRFLDAEDVNRKILSKRRQIKAPMLDIIRSRAQLVSDQIELGRFKSAKVLFEINIELLKSKISEPALLKFCERRFYQCNEGLMTPKDGRDDKGGKLGSTEMSKYKPEDDFVKPQRESIVNYDQLLKERNRLGVGVVESRSNLKTTPAASGIRNNRDTSPEETKSKAQFKGEAVSGLPSMGPTSKGPRQEPLVPTLAGNKKWSPAKQDNEQRSNDKNSQPPGKRSGIHSKGQNPTIIDVEFRPRSLSHNGPSGSGSAFQFMSSKNEESGDSTRLDVPMVIETAVQPKIDSSRTKSATGYRDKLDPSARPRSASPQPHQSFLQKRFNPPLFDAKEGQSDAASIHSVDGWFYDLQTRTQELLQPLRKDRCKRVKIAILDSGIDLTHPSFLNKQSKKIRRINTVEDFVESGGSGQDTCGHGTHCLGLLRRIAPEADIYVARVVRDSEGKLDPNIIAKAINRASRSGKDETGIRNWDVDIITMSCGFYSWVEVVKEAIEEAYRKPTLIFAAASNNGKRNQVAFPAYMPGVICVNSSTANGTPSDFNPKFDASRSLCILGENVTSTWIANQNLERRMSGTSVATPIAAAIAALIHEFALQTDPSDESLDEILKQQLKWLKSYNGVMEMFALMAEPTGEYRTIIPWNVLSVDFDRGGVAHMIKVAMTKKFGKS